MKRALLIGSNGTIGHALANVLKSDYDLITISRASSEHHRHFQSDYSDASLDAIAQKLTQNVKEKGGLDLIICCIGVLHNDVVGPEKRVSQLDSAKLTEYFRINTILPALCLKSFVPALSKSSDSRFVFLSAMVGSIGDNVLGGWYGYRSSKAALNMMVKTASIELARSHKRCALAVIHPGTTQGPLSKPFAAGVADDKYYTPVQSAERIVAVAESLSPQDTGSFLNWDGRPLPW